MLSRLLLLVLVAALVAGIWLLVRRAGRGRIPTGDRLPRAAPHELAAPALAEGDGLGPNEVFTRLHELAFGATALGSPTSSEHDSVAAAAKSAIDAVATDSTYAPRRPLLLPQLLRAMNDSEISRRELASIIARDPALAGSLLKLANSSFYRINTQPVESIDRAVALLGTEGIRSLVAAAIMQPVFRVAGGEFTRFPEITWEHTLHSAAAAEIHAATVEHADPFAAQLLGLLMGLGAIIVFRVALDQYAARPKLRPDAAVIVRLLDTYTADVARRIATSWNLSERILVALENQMPGRNIREPTPLGRCLHFGQLIGALAVLHANASIDLETAKASMLASGSSAAQFERVWTRLTVRAKLSPKVAEHQHLKR